MGGGVWGTEDLLGLEHKKVSSHFPEVNCKERWRSLGYRTFQCILLVKAWQRDFTLVMNNRKVQDSNKKSNALKLILNFYGICIMTRGGIYGEI